MNTVKIHSFFNCININSPLSLIRRVKNGNGSLFFENFLFFVVKPAKTEAFAGFTTRRQPDLEALSVLQFIKPSAPHVVSFSKPAGFKKASPFCLPVN